MTVHELKCWPRFWEEVITGRKTVEVRHDDRGYRVGDTLVLNEWNPVANAYTGARLTCRVREVYDLTAIGLLDFVAMRIEEVRP